ncbi:hypothetical protein [Mariniplasma anaerobium]|uniref:Class I SAM-dependent methyltransferase n=1 Tax=Mariniplasma anaerobium TaxID=2735436 RepID=A0A7U9TGL1_9MOLU|nr:hypothetical protein [Mariniplasma anaerobium]BCR35718.1 hypothetical protein MPAN_006110 [Mariniplasma anaerobium]
MSTIKAFNQILNASDIKRFDNWSSYRKRLTTFLYECIKNKHKNLIILGAGNLDDIDLDVFAHLFDTITLSDIDIKALEKAKHKYKSAAHKIQLKEMEYTGLRHSDYWNDFINKMLSFTNQSEIKAYFSILKKEIKQHKFVFDTKYDVVIVTPIYTQLLLQQILKDITILSSLNYPKNLLNYIESQALDIMPTVIQTFNFNISSILSDTGRLCVVSDIFEAKINSEFYQKIKIIIDDETQMSKFHSNYVKTYGIGIGDYGLEHFLKSRTIKKSQWFEWPFDINTSIFVKAIFFNHTK